VIEHRWKNSEDEPRGVIFEHDLIGENCKRIGSSMELLKDSERIRLKERTTRYGSVRLR
jgi:hypothetical protein